MICWASCTCQKNALQDSDHVPAIPTPAILRFEHIRAEGFRGARAIFPNRPSANAQWAVRLNSLVFNGLVKTRKEFESA
jgi:hypothetical protein